MRLRVTPSRADLAFACAWPFRPDVEVEEQDVGDAAAHGTAVHALAAGEHATPEAAAEAHGAPEFEDVRRDYKTWLRWVREAGFPADTAEKELALAYDWRTVTARRLAPQHARDYSGATDTEVAGTIDAMWRDGDGTLTVVDWKTGRQEGLPSAAQSGQLALCGLMAACLCEAERVMVGYVHLRDDGTWWDDWHVYEADDLVRLAERVAALMDALPTAEPTPGPHCARATSEGWGCPAAAQCPTTAAALVRVMTVPEAEGKLSIRLTRENAGAAWVAIAKARELADALEQQVAALAKDGGVPLPDGRVLERVTQHRAHPHLNGENAGEAEEWLEREGLIDAVRYRLDVTREEARNVAPLVSGAGIKASVTWSDIKKAGGAEKEREARKALAAMGAVVTNDVDVWRTRKA